MGENQQVKHYSSVFIFSSSYGYEFANLDHLIRGKITMRLSLSTGDVSAARFDRFVDNIGGEIK